MNEMDRDPRYPPDWRYEPFCLCWMDQDQLVQYTTVPMSIKYPDFLAGLVDLTVEAWRIFPRMPGDLEKGDGLSLREGVWWYRIVQPGLYTGERYFDPVCGWQPVRPRPERGQWKMVNDFDSFQRMRGEMMELRMPNGTWLEVQHQLQKERDEVFPALPDDHRPAPVIVDGSKAPNEDVYENPPLNTADSILSPQPQSVSPFASPSVSPPGNRRVTRSQTSARKWSSKRTTKRAWEDTSPSKGQKNKKKKNSKPTKMDDKPNGDGEDSNKDRSKSPASSPVRGSTRGFGRGSGRGSGRGTARGFGRGTARASIRGSGRGSGRGSVRGSGRGSIRGAIRDSGRGSIRGAARGGAGRAPVESPDRGPKQGFFLPPKQPSLPNHPENLMVNYSDAATSFTNPYIGGAVGGVHRRDMSIVTNPYAGNAAEMTRDPFGGGPSPFRLGISPFANGCAPRFQTASSFIPAGTATELALSPGSFPDEEPVARAGLYRFNLLNKTIKKRSPIRRSSQPMNLDPALDVNQVSASEPTSQVLDQPETAQDFIDGLSASDKENSSPPERAKLTWAQVVARSHADICRDDADDDDHTGADTAESEAETIHQAGPTDDGADSASINSDHD